MDKKLISLDECGSKVSSLNRLVSSLTETQISELLTQRIAGSRGDPVPLLKALLKGCGNSDNGLKARHHIFCCCIKLIQDTTINAKVATHVVGLLLMDIDYLGVTNLAELTDLYIEMVKNKEMESGRAFELLPKILATLATKENVIHGNNDMTGSKFKDHVLNILCSNRWESHCIIHLASIFREISMENSQLEFVILKILRAFPRMDMQELPPLIYQLLLLTNKGHKQLVLQGINDFFDNLEKQVDREESEDIFSLSTVTCEGIQHVQGTVIVHVTFAIRQDHTLGKELVKLLKARQQSDPSAILQTFTTALVLAVSRIDTFTEQMITILKTAILKCYKNMEMYNLSKFIEEVTTQLPDIASDILNTVKNSSIGWDHVTQGLIDLGFALMESYGPKAVFGGKVLTPEPTAILTANQKACNLGISILSETFKLQEAARQDVLDQVLNHILTNAAGPVPHYIKLLTTIIQSSPQTMLDFQPKIREALDYLTFLPLGTADGFLKAIQPLAKVSISLKDALMLVLRKATFSRQGDARKIAVAGYMLILKNFKVYGSLPSSQASQTASLSNQVFADVHQKWNKPSDYESIICAEILGCLRRSFSQQADVRLLLYEGLHEVLVRNSQLKGDILELLYNQLERYYVNDEDVLPPLKLVPCIAAQGEDVYLTEPLTHLVMTVAQSMLVCKQMATRHDGEEEDEEDMNIKSLLERLEVVLSSLINRMISSEMEDFELDKSADYSTTNGVGIRNNIFAILVLGIYEVLMEYVINNGDYSSSKCEQMLQLFNNYHSLSQVLKEKSGAKKCKEIARSLLSVKFVTETVRALFSINSPSHHQGLSSLRQNAHFLQYIVLVAQQKIQQVDTRGQCDGPEGMCKDKLFRYCSQLARVFLLQITSPSVEANQQNKGKTIPQLCLECLSTIVHVVCTRYPDKVEVFLDQIDVESEIVGCDGQEQIHAHIKKFQRILMSNLTSEDEENNVRDAVHLCDIISLLSKHLLTESPQLTDLYSWLLRVCEENNPDDNVLCKALMSLLLSLTTRIKTGVKLVRDISQDIHAQIGDIDQDVEGDNRTNLSIINPRTAAPSILLLLTSHVERLLEETDWLLNQMIAQVSGLQSDTKEEQVESIHHEKKETIICTRLGFMVNSFHELVQAAVPVGTSSDALFKTLIHLYVTLGQLCKYYLNVYNLQKGQFCEKFEKLVKLSGTHLTEHVYTMITYVQAAESEQLNQLDGRGKGGGKAKGKKKRTKNDMSKNALRVLRSSRPIPNLVYSIEQYERLLIKLGKVSKVNLMEHMKLTTSRDFRINAAAIEASMEHDSSEEEAIVDESQDDDSEDDVTPTKKRKSDKATKK